MTWLLWGELNLKSELWLLRVNSALRPFPHRDQALLSASIWFALRRLQSDLIGFLLHFPKSFLYRLPYISRLSCFTNLVHEFRLGNLVLIKTGLLFWLILLARNKWNAIKVPHINSFRVCGMTLQFVQGSSTLLFCAWSWKHVGHVAIRTRHTKNKIYRMTLQNTTTTVTYSRVSETKSTNEMMNINGCWGLKLHGHQVYPWVFNKIDHEFV